jgi:hypothetical protein
MSYDGHRANSGGEDRTTNYSFHDFFFSNRQIVVKVRGTLFHQAKRFHTGAATR